MEWFKNFWHEWKDKPLFWFAVLMVAMVVIGVASG